MNEPQSSPRFPDGLMFSVQFGPREPIRFGAVSGLSAGPTLRSDEGTPDGVRSLSQALSVPDKITLAHGVFPRTGWFWDWYSAIKTRRIKRGTVIIQQLHEQGGQSPSWTLVNAVPVNIRIGDFRAETDIVTVEDLDLTFETMTQS